MTREQHLAWCKKRAHECVDHGDCREAIALMCSDIQKHDETWMLGTMLGALRIAAYMDVANPSAIRKWIDGFN